MRKVLLLMVSVLLLTALASCGATSGSSGLGGVDGGPTSEPILGGPTAEPGTGDAPVVNNEEDVAPTQTVEMQDYVDDPLDLSPGDTVSLTVADGTVQVTFDGVNMNEPARFTGEGITVVDRAFRLRFEDGRNALSKKFPASLLMLGDVPLAMVVYRLDQEKGVNLEGVTLYLHKSISQQ